MQTRIDKRPQPMRFQARDREIFFAVQKYDGILTRRQIKAIFWPQASVQAMERRLTLLHRNGDLDWPTQ